MSTRGLLQSVSLSVRSPHCRGEGLPRPGGAGGCSITKAGAYTARHGGKRWLGTAGCACSWVPATETPGTGAMAGKPGVLQWVPAGTVLCYLLSKESIAAIPAVPRCLCTGLGAHAHSRQHWETPCPHPHVLAVLLPPCSREGTGSVHASPSQCGPLQQCIRHHLSGPTPEQLGDRWDGARLQVRVGRGVWSHWLCLHSRRWGHLARGERRSSTALARHLPALGKSKTPAYQDCCGPPLIPPPGLGLCLAASSLISVLLAGWPCLHGFQSHFCTVVP